MAYHMAAALRGEGASGRFTEQVSAWRLFRARLPGIPGRTCAAAIGPCRKAEKPAFAQSTVRGIFRMAAPISSNGERSSMEGLMGLRQDIDKEGAIVIPVFNEEKNLRATVEEIRRERITWDIITVDDGSTDGSREVLEKLPVTVISHPVNLGYGRGV